MELAERPGHPLPAPEARPGTTVVAKLQHDVGRDEVHQDPKTSDKHDKPKTGSSASALPGSDPAAHEDSVTIDQQKGKEWSPTLNRRVATPHPGKPAVPIGGHAKEVIALKNFRALDMVQSAPLDVQKGSILTLKCFDLHHNPQHWFIFRHGKFYKVESGWTRGLNEGSSTLTTASKPARPPPRSDSLDPPSTSQAAFASIPVPIVFTDGRESPDLTTTTVDQFLLSNPNLGRGNRDYVPSRSAPPHQDREDRQLTPPLAPPTPTLAELRQANDNRKSRDRQVELREGLFDAGKGELFYTLTRRADDAAPKTSVLNIATLQHMALHQLQYDISCYVKYMYQTSQFWMQLQGFPPLAELMKSYCEAVQNLDYMTHCALRGYEEDPFLMKSSRALERRTMETVGLIPDHVLPTGPLPLPQDHKRPLLREMGRNEANKAAHEKKRVLRFSMAATGGIFLIVPMIIMATVPGLISSLITTCVSVLVFAGLVAWRTDLSPNEVLGTTAAYTAVLVVFVGTSLTPKAPLS